MKRKFLTLLAACSSVAFSTSLYSADTADIWIQVFGPFSNQVAAGETFTYEYNIRNDGPGISEDVTLRDFLPPEVEYVDSLIDHENSQGFDRLGCGVVKNSGGGEVLWCPIGDIEPTGRVPIFVFATVRVKPDIASGVAIVNDANIDLHDTEDPDISNNKDSVSLIGIAQRQASPSP